jgi:hypothetical protein
MMSKYEKQTRQGIAKGQSELQQERQKRLNSQTVKYEPKQYSGKTLSRMSDELYQKWYGVK